MKKLLIVLVAVFLTAGSIFVFAKSKSGKTTGQVRQPYEQSSYSKKSKKDVKGTRKVKKTKKVY